MIFFDMWHLFKALFYCFFFSSNHPVIFIKSIFTYIFLLQQFFSVKPLYVLFKNIWLWIRIRKSKTKERNKKALCKLSFNSFVAKPSLSRLSLAKAIRCNLKWWHLCILVRNAAAADCNCKCNWWKTFNACD